MQISLIHGDCLMELKRLPNKSVHAVITDPPADIPYLTQSEWGIDNRHKLILNCFKELLRITVPGSYALVWSLPKESHRTAWAIEEAGWRVIDVVCHHFGTGQPKSGRLKPATEFWILAQNGSGRSLNAKECMVLDPSNLPMKWSSPRGGFWGQKNNDNAVLIPNESGRWPSNLVVDEAVAELLPRFFYVKKPLGSARNGHPTQKPDDLMEYLVRLISFPGETVTDPFAGSGSTGVAAKSQGRSFVGIEKDPTYYELARARLGETP